ncbi:hypothetical protein RD792_014365 [Penstemon davidsonii]|uniref:Clp R domain-containing protein n=1 Tax=Penstemon davidsonii TaxID=160366 RepID=A0ABR0CP47_9LAMI|nr:hypothetical protein RD792_014365 [Penstemon davidsonii]
MRAGNCAVQQALTTEASTIVKQAVALAKRRGHAQVTPLHVANTMLSSPTGLLRVACLQSHSHPLQCKALELCFNVALNRLPASSSNPILTHHSQYPSISNALVAAFKRAQAHQRRGSVENQQQPILAVKIEIEQLIISILDDPSVSRVMREAGFSSTQVKCNVEKAVTLELCSSQSSPPNITHKSQEGKLNPSNPIRDPIRDEDVNNIIETLLSSSRKQSIVVVGECVSTVESTVKGLMERVDKGIVPDELKEVKFISIPPLYSFCNLRREEVEQKIGELTCLVKSLVSRGVVLYLGDLKWISDYRVNLEQEKSYYCSVEHVIMELGRLACGIGEMGKFWLMGIATFQTYMRCRTGHHSLENVWGLYPVTIPANSLGFSLISKSDEADGAAKLSCCTDCKVKFEAEARSCGTNEPTLSRLPPWLKDESRRINSKDQSREHSIMELCKKWNSYCTSTHKQPQSNEITLTFSSTSPSSSTSCFSFDQHNPNFLQKHFPFSSNPNSTPNSTSSSDIMDTYDHHYTKKFKEFNSENLKTLCNAIEKNVPWQKELIPEIAGTVLQCRSKMLKRKDNLSGHISKEETWLFFLGPDVQAKEKISRDLAKVVFGSYSDFITVGLNSSGFISSSSDDCRNKRGRDEQSCSSYIERFSQAVCANPHRVFFVEDLDLADHKSRLGMKSAIEKGRICNANGDEVGFSDAIVVFSCERFRSCRSRGCSPSSKQKMEEETSGCVSLDLNISFDEGQNRHVEDDQSFDELGILENVDRVVNFNIQEL